MSKAMLIHYCFNYFDKAAIKTVKSLAKDCKCFHSNKNLFKIKNFKMIIIFMEALFSQ